MIIIAALALVADFIATLYLLRRTRRKLERRIEELTVERDNLLAEVAAWELTAVREGLLTKGDIER